MKKLAIGLWWMQLLAAAFAFAAAAAQVQSIIISAPALSIVGLLLASVTLRLNSWWPLAFGLSGPLVCAAGATLIAVYSMGPGQAGRPIAILLGAYFVLIVIPLAAVSLREIRRWELVKLSENGRPLQYSVRTLLIWTTAACVLATIGRYVFQNVAIGPTSVEKPIFISFAAAAILLSGAVVWLFLANRRARRSTEPGDRTRS